MIFYTADLHLSHSNIMRFSSRPFESVKEMNETLVNNWNSVVSAEDDVYIIGDVLFKMSIHPEAYLEKMKGRKHLIIGNHDRQHLSKDIFTSQFETIDHYLVISDEGRKVVLFHYPILEWDGYFRGSYHIYGHIHNSENIANKVMKKIPNAFNAGVDVNDYTPQTLSQLIARNRI